MGGETMQMSVIACGLAPFQAYLSPPHVDEMACLGNWVGMLYMLAPFHLHAPFRIDMKHSSFVGVLLCLDT